MIGLFPNPMFKLRIGDNLFEISENFFMTEEIRNTLLPPFF
jgi:hypothetical protein